MGSLTSSVASANADHSRFVQRIRRRYGDELALLPAGLPRAAVIAELVLGVNLRMMATVARNCF